MDYCVPVEVEAEIEVVQVQKDVLRDLPDGLLRDAREHGVASLVEGQGSGAGQAVCKKADLLQIL